MANLPITPEWTKQLLALSSTAEQVRFLQAENLADESGLHHLLDYADEEARNSPLHARSIALVCQNVADHITVLPLIPQAVYLEAKTYILAGEAHNALALLQRARTEFTNLNMTVEALRTDVGLVNAHVMLGDYRAALETGDSTLVQIDAALESADQETAQSLQMVRGKVHVNQGPAFSESGRFEEALNAYAQAEAIFKSLQITKREGSFESIQLTSDLAYILNNRGVALRYLGRVDEALAAYQQAAALRPARGYFYALLLTNIGDAQLLLGNYQASLQAYRDARQEFSAQELDADQMICASHMADVYLALNLYPEALALYQEAADKLRSTDFHYYRGKALWGVGAVQSVQGDLDASTGSFREAIEIFTEIENSPLRAGLLLEQAANQAAVGNVDTARSTTEQAFDLLSQENGNAWPVQNVYAHLRMADLLLPNLDEAEAHLMQAESLLHALPLPHLRYRLLQRLGHIRRLQNRNEEAQRLFEEAIDEVERLRSSLASETFRISFQQDKMSAYEELIQLHLQDASSLQRAGDEGGIERTFDLIERAKSRALVERMSGMAETFSDNSDDEESAMRLQNIRARLNAIYSDLLGQETGDSDEQETRGDRAVRMDHLNQQASILERELTEINLQSSMHTKMAQPFAHTLSMQQIQQQLAPDLTMLSYHVAGDEILAFVITKENIQLVRNLCTPLQIQSYLDKLNVQWGHFRTRQAFIERHLPRLEQNARQLLLQLYGALFAPLESLFATIGTASRPKASQKEGAQKVVVVPHGLLHQVPFHAFFDGNEYLIERLELSYAPSATVYIYCQQKAMKKTNNILALAVSDPAIPAVEAETQAIARTLPQATTFLNENATLHQLHKSIDDSRVIHFACHGLYRIDNPSYSALKLHDGWLTAVEVAQLDLAGMLVVLSACESGRGAVLAGDEMIGLARACLSAGANSLVVSQWLVQDDTGAMLMAEWYARLARGQDAASALRAAQLSLKSSHPHPYYWAPFVLMGRRAEVF